MLVDPFLVVFANCYYNPTFELVWRTKKIARRARIKLVTWLQRANVLSQHSVLYAWRMAAAPGARAKVLNFNVGVLGHIDSGKTSLGTYESW